jgi:fused signal recognition particle receptor
MFGALKAKLKKWVSKNEDVEKPTKKIKVKLKAEEPKVKLPKPKKKKSETKEKPKDELEQSLEETIEAPIKEKGFFSKFHKKLTEEKFNELFEELEIILLQNNVAYGAVESIKESLEEKLVGKSLKDVNLATELKNSIESLLINPPNFLEEIKESLEVKKPFVILFSGINGSGKTTTIAKVANYLQKNKLSVCLAAADTFRAAAIQQLEEHANRLKVPIIKKDYGSDPASVGFDAITYAKKNKIDVVLIDTAGRMQNKDSLMKEIEKIARVNNPDMRIFLGESITGNDATEQAKAFNDTISITGIILSKADVDEKGGTAISVSHITKKPILFLGTGQEYKDLEPFDKKDLIKKLGL